MKRKAVSKGLRFDIFKRDGFTCQYCGKQPPGVVLHLDHIRPVAEGGDNDEMNLVTSCQDCNLGKGKKLLDTPHLPDADLAWLASQQEVAELRAFQESKKQEGLITDDVIKTLQKTWRESGCLDWHPAEHVIRAMLKRYDAEMIDDAFADVSYKLAEGRLWNGGEGWLKYTWGVLRRMKDQANG